MEGEIVGITVYVLLFLFGVMLITPSRTRRYRKELSDLYVAGRIKQIAKKDNIDLDEELKSYRLYRKKRNIESSNLDNTIEEDLQDKIVDEESKEKKK